ncbi:MAG: hypothetical protein RR049_06255 [Angelakisella sp.]
MPSPLTLREGRRSTGFPLSSSGSSDKNSSLGSVRPSDAMASGVGITDRTL